LTQADESSPSLKFEVDLEGDEYYEEETIDEEDLWEEKTIEDDLIARLELLD
jgi:hypothetical protein